MPVALTIAGSDSGGGAGIQADLKVFAALGVHGTSAITCVTAQNPRQVLGIAAVSPKIIRLQIDAVMKELPPAAVKTGMLFSEAIIKSVAERAGSTRSVPWVVDPVMVATSGAHLLKPSAIRSLARLLLPKAALMTPNLDEAEVLAGMKIADPEAMREAARVLHRRHGCAVLVKGGHLRGAREALDVFYDGCEELLLTAPFIRGVSTHGTGCTYSAAITAYLALGFSLIEAVTEAKTLITRAIRSSVRIGHHSALQPLWRRRAGNAPTSKKPSRCHDCACHP